MISVIIVNYNSGGLLAECVSSVLASTVPVEVLVSDNGSTDRSLELMRLAVGDRANLAVIENGANLGFSKANNVALERASGEYLLFLNPDCIIEPDTLQKMREIMRANPEVGMAGCLIRNRDGSEQAGCRRAIPTPFRSLVRVAKLSGVLRNHPRFRSFVLVGQPLPEAPVEIEAISGAFMFVRRSALDVVGPLDENYFLHCEDLDWCMRFRQSGFRILFVPDIEIIHEKGGSSSGQPIRVEWYKHSGMIRFYRKFFRHQYPSLLMAGVFLLVWARFCAKAVVITVKRCKTLL